MAKPTTLHSDDRVAAAMNLLSALSSAPERRMARAAAAQTAGIDEDHLDEIIELVSTLADRRTGARAVIAGDSEGIRLEGDAATLLPIRLTEEEGLVLSHVLHSLTIDDGARTRIAQALLPLGADEPERDLIAETERYGGFFQQVKEAIQDGVRCEVLYRSLDDDAPARRLIDPYLLESGGAYSYLHAWDVERDAERRYRLDRIVSISFTEDSVERHPYRAESMGESLKESGVAVTLILPSEARARELGWDGMHLVQGLEDGRVVAEVSCASTRWLYSQVLSAGGDIVIVAPESVRTGLATFADGLLQD